MNNFYQIFYWITVADNVKSFLDGASNFFTWMAILSTIGFFICTGVVSSFTSKYQEDKYKTWDVWKKGFKSFAIPFWILMFITWLGFVATPSKKDALIIIAGGTVGNFITQDSSAKKVPSEVMELLRGKIKAELKETNLKEALMDNTIDTLKDKSVEELKQIIKEKNKTN